MRIRKIDDRNRISIPTSVLKFLNLTTGDLVAIENNNGHICLLKAYVSIRRKNNHGDGNGSNNKS